MTTINKTFLENLKIWNKNSKFNDIIYENFLNTSDIDSFLLKLEPIISNSELELVEQVYYITKEDLKCTPPPTLLEPVENIIDGIVDAEYSRRNTIVFFSFIIIIFALIFNQNVINGEGRFLQSFLSDSKVVGIQHIPHEKYIELTDTFINKLEKNNIDSDIFKDNLISYGEFIIHQIADISQEDNISGSKTIVFNKDTTALSLFSDRKTLENLDNYLGNLPFQVRKNIFKSLGILGSPTSISQMNHNIQIIKDLINPNNFKDSVSKKWVKQLDTQLEMLISYVDSKSLTSCDAALKSIKGKHSFTKLLPGTGGVIQNNKKTRINVVL
jgi:hypothetical protein